MRFPARHRYDYGPLATRFTPLWIPAFAGMTTGRETPEARTEPPSAHQE
ncbi:MAG: hypothetical protein AAFQ43_12325 [Bacteroidota bacterium]